MASRRSERGISSGFAATTLSILFTLLLAACQSPTQSYLKNGIGNDLYSSDLRRATENLDIYLGFICHQAGIVAPTADDGFPRCRSPMQTTEWTLLVQTGFNDIDRRCDAYLAWLESVRHRDRFYSSQLNQIGRLTNAILLATSPADAIAIGIVAEAFGYGQSLFNDYQTRIMLGYESSTIKTIVSERRLDFRLKLVGERFTNKPGVVYVLRSYLRICMPYTITMDANTYARASASGAPALTRANDPELVRQSILGVIIPESATAPVVDQGGTDSRDPPVDPDDALSEFERTRMKTSMVRRLQMALCVQNGKGRLGPANSPTRTAIAGFEQATKDNDPSSAIVVNGSIDSQTGFLSIVAMGACNTQVYNNAYERTRYRTADNLATLKTRLIRFFEFNSPGAPPTSVQSEVISPAILTTIPRETIKEAQKLLAKNPTGIIDHELDLAILRGAS